MNSPFQLADGKWYVNVGGERVGPFEEEDQAWTVLEEYLQARSCPTGGCE